MGWAYPHILKLREGKAVQFRPKGNSMRPKIKSGQLVTVQPLGKEQDPEVGDVVLCKVHGKEYLHLVKAKRCGQYQIGNNQSHINGWIKRDSIFGILSKVED